MAILGLQTSFLAMTPGLLVWFASWPTMFWVSPTAGVLTLLLGYALILGGLFLEFAAAPRIGDED